MENIIPLATILAGQDPRIVPEQFKNEHLPEPVFKRKVGRPKRVPMRMPIGTFPPQKNYPAKQSKLLKVALKHAVQRQEKPNRQCEFCGKDISHLQLRFKFCDNENKCKNRSTYARRSINFTPAEIRKAALVQCEQNRQRWLKTEERLTLLEQRIQLLENILES